MTRLRRPIRLKNGKGRKLSLSLSFVSVERASTVEPSRCASSLKDGAQFAKASSSRRDVVKVQHVDAQQHLWVFDVCSLAAPYQVGPSHFPLSACAPSFLTSIVTPAIPLKVDRQFARDFGHSDPQMTYYNHYARRAMLC